MPRRKRHYTDVRFGECVGAVRLMTDGGQVADLTIEGVDLDMVTAAFFHLFGYAVEPGLKRFQLRKYKNASFATVTDDRMSIYYPSRRKEHALAWSLSSSDDRPGELRLWVQSTQAKMYMNFMMDKATTAEFGCRLAAAAEWDLTS